MTYERIEAPSRPPLAWGCLGIAAVVAAAAFIVGGCVVFLESGSNTGQLTLNSTASYSPGTIDYVGTRNFFVVRLLDGSFYAVSDLDAANRESAQRRCRARLVDFTDPALADRAPSLRARQGAAAAGTQVALLEDCNGAVYDITGIRLDADGPNLDRYPTSTDDRGRLQVDLANRLCTTRDETAIAVETPCP